MINNEDIIASVIVPTFRREEALCKMLQTLLAQDCDGFEILLIDQTPNHDQETIAFLTLNADRIKRVVQEIPNLPMARNNGLSRASGKFILYVDDDVLLPADCVRRLIAHLSAGAAHGVSGLISFEQSDEELKLQYGLKVDPQPESLIIVNQFIGAVMAFRREVFDSAGGFDERLGILSTSASGEDSEFCRRARSAGYRLAIDPTLVIQHPLGVTGGCATREVSSDVARTRHIRSNFYIEMKLSDAHGRIGIAGWVRMLRGWAVNREAVANGFGAVFKNIHLLRKQYKEVQEFYLQGNNAERP